MKNLLCMSSCLLAGLKRVVRENFYIILTAMVIGALYGVLLSNFQVGLYGSAMGIVLAILYGYIPYTTECAGDCRVS